MGVVALESQLFLQLLRALQDGLACTSDPRYVVLSASCLDQLATFLFQNMRKTMPAMDKLRGHLSQAPGAFVELLEVLTSPAPPNRNPNCDQTALCPTRYSSTSSSSMTRPMWRRSARPS